MSRTVDFIERCWAEEDGQDLVEYSLLLAFVALASVAILSSAGSSVKSLWGMLSNAFTSATAAGS